VHKRLRELRFQPSGDVRGDVSLVTRASGNFARGGRRDVRGVTRAGESVACRSSGHMSGDVRRVSC